MIIVVENLVFLGCAIKMSYDQNYIFHYAVQIIEKSERGSLGLLQRKAYIMVDLE